MPLSKRNKNAHKNDFGHVLVVAGSPSMLGAAALTGLASMRCGTGLTTAAVARSLNLALQKKLSPVIMTMPLPETRKGTTSSGAFSVLEKVWPKYTAVAVGPGMTMVSDTIRFVEKMYKGCPLPLVVDADALNALAGKLDRFSEALAPRILTPHPGEMARLTGLSRKQIETSRQRVALTYAKRWGCVLLLKGHRTVIASPDGNLCINTSGNPGMATAGSGDVLTGMIASFCAQGMGAFEAARLGAFLHGKAGDLALKEKGEAGLIATDILEAIPKALKRRTHG